MERKNTILLTVIAVATLLVAVVGATFAYFTATESTTGNASGETSAKTAEIPQISFFKETVAGSEHAIYPGTKNAVGAKYTAKLTGDGTAGKTYTLTYKLTGKVNLLDKEGSAAADFKFPIKWTLYESTTSLTAETIVTCDAVKEEDVGTQVHYSQTCTESGSIGTPVKSGIINPTDGTTIEEDDANGATIVTGTDATVEYETTVDVTSEDTVKYYYLVVEYTSYPASSQNEDMGKTIKASITDITVSEAKEKTA